MRRSIPRCCDRSSPQTRRKAQMMIVPDVNHFGIFNTPAAMGHDGGLASRLAVARRQHPIVADPGLTMARRTVASARIPLLGLRPPAATVTMIIDCHGHYTTEPKDLHRFRKEQTAAANAKDKAAMPPRAALKMSDDEIRESIEQNQLKLQRERGTDITIFSPRASGMGHHVGDESVSVEWTQICNDLIARVVSLYPKNFIGVCQLPQSQGVRAEELRRRARALRQDGLRRLQPEPRSVRRLLQRAADDRQVVVSVLREDDRARRAGDDPRLGLLQSGAAHHRLVLSQRRHHGVHADHPVGPVQGLPQAQVHHPARRRRGAVPLGPLPRHRAQQQPARARPDHGQQHLLRHLRLSSAGHRPARQGGAGRQHPVRVRDGGRREGHRPEERASISTTPSAMSTTQPASRPRTRRRSSKATPTRSIQS